MSLADNASEVEIETAVMMLDPAVQDIAASTAGMSDRSIDCPAFRAALREVANSFGIADSSMEALTNAVNRLRVNMNISKPQQRDGGRAPR